MTDRWRALDDSSGLYELARGVDSGWHFRSVALGLPDGDAVVVSPLLRCPPSSEASLRQIGQPTLALAPNHYHHMGLRELQGRHEGVTVVATETASRRLKGKLGYDVASVGMLRERLPEHVRLLEPPGLRTGEAWLRVQTGRGLAWVVSDAFFTIPGPLSGPMGMLLRATATAPGLRIGNTFRWVAVANRRVYRGWLLEQLAADRPRLLIPSHGDVIEGDDLAERLDELVRRRL